LKDTLLLFPTKNTLDNVTIRDWKTFVKKSFAGYFFESTSSTWGMIKGSNYAALITGDSTKEEWITKVMIRFASPASCSDRFQVQLLTFDETTRSPGRDLLNKPLQFTNEGNRKKKIIDVSEEHLIMPAQGIVAVIELVSRNAECPSNENSRIACIMKKVNGHSWFAFSERVWYPDIPHPGGKSMIPCIGLELAKRN
jgi:hypothetical protein